MLKQRPLLEAACWWSAGYGLAHLYSGAAGWLLWAGLGLIYPLYGLQTGRTKQRILGVLAIFTAAFIYWHVYDSLNVTALPKALKMQEEQLNESIIRVQGTIVSAVERDGDRVDFTMEVKQAAPSASSDTSGWSKLGREKVRVQVKLAKEQDIQTAEAWSRGQRIEVYGTLEKPEAARNFGGFDYSRYLHYKHIHWLLKVPGASEVKISQGHFSKAKLLGYNDQMRKAVGRQIGVLFGGLNSGFMKGLLIGDTEELDQDLYNGFSALGLTHILAISGSHVAINAGVLFWLFRRLRVPREVSYTLVIGFIPFYMLLTGLSPSVVRSGLMAVIGLYLLRQRRLKDGLNILAAAVLLMLLWEPYYLLDVSFQLSFAVTGGLILFVPLVQPLVNFLPKRLAGAASITLAAQLISFPLTIYYFNQFSLLSLLSNLLLVPVVSLLALPAGTAALVISWFSEPLGRWAAYPVKELNLLTFDAVAWLEARTGFMTIWKSPPLWWIGAYYLSLYLLLKYSGAVVQNGKEQEAGPGDETLPLTPDMAPKGLLHPPHSGFSITASIQSAVRAVKEADKRSLYPALLCAAVLAGALYWGYQPVYAKGSGYVQFLDVGQGDCMLITTPEGRSILVDGGGTVSFRKAGEAWRDKKVPYEVGAKLVVPLLKKRGIHQLDAVIVTHWDQDHAGGLQAVLEQIPVKALIANGSMTDTDVSRSILEAALQLKIPVYFAHDGMKLQPDKLTTLTFIGPVEEEGEIERGAEGAEGGTDTDENPPLIPLVEEQNGRSVVFLMNMDSRTLLFTGDMTAEEEHSVLERLEGQNGALAGSAPLGPGPVDVLKVAHHGSKTSTSDDWLYYWKPLYAAISVGANNLYGHPNSDVVNRLNAAGANILRTDELGEIQIKVDNRKMNYRNKLTK
ncbi:ComEC/Rec2 family competence protein [Paenibacillus pinistramenti]|uniref:ComEC/Rec2 family competence protein n=1 Tax=Paenibacillus pinistramenti TaxID=1768003 RepID=UPI001EEFAC55|nr:ComEC/Rec2 family competence protein [Paenibacillus pinistramenti]